MVSEREPLEDDELRELLDAADRHAEDLREPTATRDRMFIYVLANVGLRSSALAHMTRDWIDFQDRQVTVPPYQDCNSGRGGGPCSECVQRLDLLRAGYAMSRGEVHRELAKPVGGSMWNSYADPGDTTVDDRPASLYGRARRFDRYARRPGVGRSDLKRFLREKDGMWFPKSGSGHRPVPVKDDTTWEIIQDYFQMCDDVAVTRQTVGNVLGDVARKADLTRSVKPHEMRHTFGTRMAAMDFDAYEIKDAMGHATIAQAEDYIRLAGKRLSDAFSDKWESV